MSNKTATYRPSSVSASIVGVPIEGFIKGTFIDIERQDAAFTTRKATDGTVAVFVDKYATYTVSFYLQSTSPANNWLHLMFKLFMSYGISFKMPIMISDKSGSTTFFATDCYFETEPPTAFSDVVESVEWRIICHDGSYTKGGNIQDNDLVEAIQTIVQVVSLAGLVGMDLGELEQVALGYAENAAQSVLGGLSSLI